ncbi:hypothetical protein DFH27DRAFT_328115 [Peziza echinospora]|nr:hypothetical protein DFH27DRAFT_328115 [Peziza echinospora]
MSGSSSMRRAIVAPTSSYASVVAGQSRASAPSGSDSHQNISGANRFTPGSSTFSSKQPQAVPNVASFPLPPYLKQSAYAERLAQHAKTQQAKSPSFNSLPTPPSSLPLSGRLPPAHRGLAYDVVEIAPVEEDSISPLPSRWNDADKCHGIELTHAGLEVKFAGPHKSSENDAAAVRSDHSIPPQCGIFYYECTILSEAKESLIAIGFSTSKPPMTRLPGWEPESWGYHGDDGNAFSCHAPGKAYGPLFASGDIIGCGINFKNNTAFFTKNGTHLGIAFREIKGKLYPSVGMKKAGERVRANFGQEPFCYDIEGYVKEEKANIYKDVNQTHSALLQPNLDESALIQALISSYLAHDGYVETARAFARDVQKESQALATSGTLGSRQLLDIKEDQDAINRQKIRTAILDGDVDKALKLTKAYYPEVFNDNEMTYFRLKCRKLVEMIGVVSEASTRTTNYANDNLKQNQDEPMEDVFGREMDIDDHSSGDGQWERMDVEEDEGIAQVKAPLDAAVKYAQDLRIEFQADKRPEIRKALEESFSLVAYQDPKNSTLSHLFDDDGRIAVAEELNSAILVSLGKSSVAPLERLVQQATALIQELSEDGGTGAFVNVNSDFLKTCNF